MRKSYVNLTVRVIINSDEGVDVGDVVNDLEYTFTSTSEGAEVIDTEIKSYEITDSK